MNHTRRPNVETFREIAGDRTGEVSAEIHGRVVAARQRQHGRFNGKPRVTCNAHMGPKELKQFCRLDDHTKEMLQLRREALIALPVAAASRRGVLSFKTRATAREPV